MGELTHGGDTLCVPALCASFVIWYSLHFVVGRSWVYASLPHVVVGDFSLHFVAGLGRASVGGWYQGPLGLYPICAAARRTVTWLCFVATCCGGRPGHVLGVMAA